MQLDQFEILGIKQIVRDYIEFVPAFTRELIERTAEISYTLDYIPSKFLQRQSFIHKTDNFTPWIFGSKAIGYWGLAYAKN